MRFRLDRSREQTNTGIYFFVDRDQRRESNAYLCELLRHCWCTRGLSWKYWLEAWRNLSSRSDPMLLNLFSAFISDVAIAFPAFYHGYILDARSSRAERSGVKDSGSWGRNRSDAGEISTHRVMKYKRDVAVTHGECPTFLGYVTNKGIRREIMDDRCARRCLRKMLIFRKPVPPPSRVIECKE